MSRRQYTVPYGMGELAFSLPSGFKEAMVAEHAGVSPLADVLSSIRSSLENPVGSAPLKELARPGDKVCIVVTDGTRPCPDHLLIPPLLEELRQAGVPREDVTLLVGVGMHRATTSEEKESKLGTAVVANYRVYDSDPLDASKLVDLGLTSNGVPGVVSRLACEADLLIATGVVEPHLYAGYSGGRKAVAIGAGGERTIEVTHGPAMLDHEGTRLGRIDGNPFHVAVTEIAKKAGLRFIVNVVLDDNAGVVSVEAGEPEATFQRLVGTARSLYEATIPHQFDAVIGGVGHPKDANLYQASRVPTYLFFAPTPVVREGGTIIIPAPCPEGVGQGLGEKRFHEIMKYAASPSGVVESARKDGYPAGGQRAFVLARVLEYCEVVVVGCEHPTLVEDLKMIPAQDITEAFRFVARKHGEGADVLIVPHALHTLPVVADWAFSRASPPGLE
ncbi:MAG TPA: nickel-dependent lactate racemase [Anaerolineae bacterium]|nr:nickel-dependent lactate racemase [Anaerolineae bacterium]